MSDQNDYHRQIGNEQISPIRQQYFNQMQDKCTQTSAKRSMHIKKNSKCVGTSNYNQDKCLQTSETQIQDSFYKTKKKGRDFVSLGALSSIRDNQDAPKQQQYSGPIGSIYSEQSNSLDRAILDDDNLFNSMIKSPVMTPQRDLEYLKQRKLTQNTKYTEPDK